MKYKIAIWAFLVSVLQYVYLVWTDNLDDALISQDRFGIFSFVINNISERNPSLIPMILQDIKKQIPSSHDFSKCILKNPKNALILYLTSFSNCKNVAVSFDQESFKDEKNMREVEKGMFRLLHAWKITYPFYRYRLLHHLSRLYKNYFAFCFVQIHETQNGTGLKPNSLACESLNKINVNQRIQIKPVQNHSSNENISLEVAKTLYEAAFFCLEETIVDENLKKIYLKNKIGLHGMSNPMSRSCYLNSSFQLLGHNIAFVHFVLSFSETELLDMPVMSIIYQILQQQYGTSKSNNIDSIQKPEDFFTILKNNLTCAKKIDFERLGDPKEFIGYVISTIEREIKKFNRVDEFKKMFKMRMDIKYRCDSCDYVFNTNAEIYNPVELQIYQFKNDNQNPFQKKFEKYSHSSKMEMEHKSDLETPCKNRELIGSNTFSDIPEFYIVHIIQESFSANTGRSIKLFWLVSFPEYSFKIENVGPQKKEQYYDLSGFICFNGQRDNSGHFFSIIKVYNDWYKFDDSTCSLLRKNIKEYAPYVTSLFYKKRSG